MRVTAGIFLASILLKEMRYQVFIRYLCASYYRKELEIIIRQLQIDGIEPLA
jgi:hypothetical protein